MCLAPNRRKDGALLACRYCSLRASNMLNDLVGCCIADQSVSSLTLAVTLTYAGDVPESALLHYRDKQLMLKRLRKDGYKVRYICADEYGAQWGRTHWHIILFFQGRSPRLAHDLVERRLPVHGPEYAFAGILDRKGKARPYWLQGRKREMWLEAYCARWSEVHGGEPSQTEFVLEKYLDPITRREMDSDTSMLIRNIERKRPKHVPDYSASDEWKKCAIGARQSVFTSSIPGNLIIWLSPITIIRLT